ncbi:MAG: periplasmic heavy metal sensor [Polyangiaceae bacterium]
MKRVGVTACLATFLFGAGVSGAMLGCGGSSANNAKTPPPPVAEVSAEEEDATAGLLEHHRHHHHGGVTLLLAMSLDTLGVPPEEKPQLEKIRQDLHARMEPSRAAEQALVGLLADGIAAGAIDTAKVDAAVAQLSSTAAAVHDASTDALNRLHAVLTPPQRAALIDKLEAHWSVWQKANTDESDHLAQLAGDLTLAPDQIDKVRASLADAMKTIPHFDPQEVAAHIRAFGDAFKAETFDAKTLTTGGPATAHMVGWGGAHMARFLESVSPVLTPDQRTKLAQRLREHMGHNPSANGGGT